MITEVLSLLRSDNHYGAGELTEIAKGKYEIPTTIKKGIKQIKRIYHDGKKSRGRG